jgi:hypothetical protein
LIDLTTEGLALSNSTAAIRFQYTSCKTPNHRLSRQIFDESAGLAANIVNGGFPDSPIGAVEVLGKPSIAGPEQFDLGRDCILPRAGICPAFHLA